MAKRGLGRGLDALIPNKTAEKAAKEKAEKKASKKKKEKTALLDEAAAEKKRLAACCNAIRSGTGIGEAYALCGFRDYSSFFNFSGETDQFTIVENLVKGPAQKDGQKRIPRLVLHQPRKCLFFTTKSSLLLAKER